MDLRHQWGFSPQNILPAISGQYRSDLNSFSTHLRWPPLYSNIQENLYPTALQHYSSYKATFPNQKYLLESQ